MHTPLPVPPNIAKTLRHKSENLVQIDYERIVRDAEAWAKSHSLKPAALDKTRVAMLIVDNQITFSFPPKDTHTEKSGYAELAVAGAPATSVRIAEFIYRNLGVITSIYPTMDTHTIMQVFHQFWMVDDQGNHPTPGVPIPHEDIEHGKWKVNPAVVYSVGGPLGPGETYGSRYNYLQGMLVHYSKSLRDSGKYPLMVWPYHSMLGGIGYSLVPSTEEALCFHTVARATQYQHQMKGGNPLTENFSIFAPEVLFDQQRNAIAQRNARLFQILTGHDIVIIAGQAKSHCVAWTINDLLTEIKAKDASLVDKVYLLDDCSDPVVIPGVIDFTNDAERLYAGFASEGMHRVLSTDPMDAWKGVKLAA